MKPYDNTELYDDLWWTDAEREFDRTRRALMRRQRLRSWDWPRTTVLVLVVGVWGYVLWHVIDGILP